VYDRLGAAERDLARLKQTDQSLLHAVDELWFREVQVETQVGNLAAELRGISTTQASVPADGRTVVIYGNGSGFTVAATLTTISAVGSGDVSIVTRRIARPSDRLHKPDPSSGPGGALPPDFESTEALDISAVGARRQIVVPCGYEIAARGNGMSARVGILAKYGAPCVQ
jgi:hypothetical protein